MYIFVCTCILPPSRRHGVTDPPLATRRYTAAPPRTDAHPPSSQGCSWSRFAAWRPSLLTRPRAHLDTAPPSPGALARRKTPTTRRRTTLWPGSWRGRPRCSGGSTAKKKTRRRRESKRHQRHQHQHQRDRKTKKAVKTKPVSLLV